MATHPSRPVDLFATHLDALLSGGGADLPAAADAPELAELLVLAGLLAETLGTAQPDPWARAAGRARLLAAARRRPPRMTAPPVPAPSNNGAWPSNVVPLPVRSHP